MKRRSTALAALPLLALLAVASQALAHRSGCHRWHSCPSDSGSYACGDTGYSNYCGTDTATAPSPAAAPPRAPAKPRYAAKGAAYVPAAELLKVSGRATPANGWYRLDVNGKRLLVQANSKSAWLGTAKFALKAAPYVQNGRLYLPASALASMGCALDVAYLPSFVVVDCGYEHGLLDTKVW